MAGKAAFQVIVLGPTGGPREDSVTGLLVRSTSKQWTSNSVIAVDAGTLLAGIIRTLERSMAATATPIATGATMTQGPFTGLTLPCRTGQANAAHIFREIIGAVFITHPHLDHLSGLAINTPILEAGAGPKTVAALPSTISAIKNHLFNDVIWPNLSDEDGGAGLLTYHRLVEGGNPRFGRGETKGYVRACDGLLAKCLSVSHGRCRQRYHPETSRHHRVGSSVFTADPLMLPSRAISVDLTDGIYSPARSPRLVASTPKDAWATVESSAFFIHDHATGSEIIVFGDVEPDSTSLDPRNRRVWEVAAPKVAAGALRAIFIECSYNDATDDASLYGHLCPRHLIAELSVLAGLPGKRKRDLSPTDGGEQVSPKSKRATTTTTDDGGSISRTERNTNSHDTSQDEPPDLVHDEQTPSLAEVVDGDSEEEEEEEEGKEGKEGLRHTRWADLRRLPLTGLSVYIIHIKDGLTDGPPPGDRILQELREQGEAAGLGCEFFVPKGGEGIWI
ncbi:hypothetical protein ASPZODRAFT_152642 [Penicilliopsis zonata CBS 506.65]|uniref:3',5'-cyclic-nucleotide phosphodiesterase n=1 Tax=Penicilliopsis zonata CBS 506.65 TaxID=1073090 RepID=A0A1L9SES7_9EURO|nr:hypothetical protein ASPZODRAFT_152642 [Penicilliopsis zonata CBS 506.65]OJJ45597.1 hypothetical protein ASPZODRAFT_152642 [Penicilliopsis zonata CBS 506.65]